MKKILKEAGGVCKLEVKRNLNRVNICCVVIFLLLCAAVLQMSVSSYFDMKKKENEFLEVEKQKIERYVNYDQYGTFGFMVFFDYSPLHNLFNNCSCTGELEAFIDSGVRLKINKPQKDGNIFEKPTGGNLDLSWFLLTVFSGLILSWAFFTFRSSENYYLKYLSNYASCGNIFAGVFLSRVLLILGVLVLELLITIIIFSANGINIFPKITGVLIFLLAAFIVMLFLLPLGFILGTVRNRARAVITAVLCWLIIVVLWPEVLNMIFSKKAANNIESRYQHQGRKLEILTGFEKLIHEKRKNIESRTERIEINKNLTEQYWQEGFKQIEALETGMIESIRDHAKTFHLLSIFNPVTFYKSVNNELSSMGYNEYLRFYRANLDKFKGFVRYYFDNRLYKKNPEVVSFLKDDEFIFKAKSSLPDYFIAGLILNLVYFLVLLLFSYSRFKKSLLPLPRRDFKEINFAFSPGKHTAFNYKDEDFPNQLYNVLAGRVKKFNGKITLSGEDMVTADKKDFTYLPDPEKMPGEIKAADLINFVSKAAQLSAEDRQALKETAGKVTLKKRFKELEDFEKVELLLNMAQYKKSQIYFIHNLFPVMPDKTQNGRVKKPFAELRTPDTLIIEAISVPPLTHRKVDRYSFIYPEGNAFKEDILE